MSRNTNEHSYSTSPVYVHYAAQSQIIIMHDHAISRQVGHVQLVYYVWLHCLYVMINDLPRWFNYPHESTIYVLKFPLAKLSGTCLNVALKIAFAVIKATRRRFLIFYPLNTKLH